MNIIGFRTLVKREIMRFLKVWSQTIFPPIITTVLYLVIFGFFIGKILPDINGIPYIDFLVPGLIMLSLINSTYANTSTSLFIMKWQNHIQEILISPLSYFEMASAFALGGIVRGFISGLSIYFVSLFFYSGAIQHVFLFIILILLISTIFSCFGIIIGVWAENWDQLGIWTTFILTPLIFLGGVFHSITLVPDKVKLITQLNPLFYMVDAFRFSMLGVSDGNLLISIPLILVLAIVTFSFSVYLFKIGYKLRS